MSDMPSMQSPRILVLGKNGMLGHMVEHVLAAARFDVHGLTHAECDAERVIASVSAREAIPAITGAAYVINCLGITAHHIRDDDPTSVARAIRVNAAFPHTLAAAAADAGVRVIHMSTDGVFSGIRSSPSRREGELEGVGEMMSSAYTETDTPDATDTYGRTKILGESHASHVLNIRTSIIGSSPVKREGLWEWVAQQPDGATIQGYTNHCWHGVTTRQFAEFCGRIIREDLFDALRADGHALHFALNEPCTKYDLLCAIRDALGKRLTIEPVAHPQAVRRILATRSATLRTLLGPPRPIAEAMRDALVVSV